MSHRRKEAFASLVGILLIAGCHSNADHALSEAPINLDARIIAAHRPVVILIGEFGPDGADQASAALVEDAQAQAAHHGFEFIPIELTVSRNRAIAARYHPAKTPLLVCLSPTGLIASRDEPPITTDLIARWLDQLQPRVIELDAKYIPLADAVENNKSDIHAQLALANFLLAQHNDREAIPHLTAIADSKTADPKLRIDAWVNMARAHLWIVEPEKARHESQALIATLGPVSPLAIAGGNLVHGLQDATAKRFALARKEFKASVAAAPDSDYAKQAAAALAQLPKEGR